MPVAPSWEVVGAAAALLALVALWLLSRWRRFWASRRARRRGARAVRGERDAEVLLEELGYRILERQAPLSWRIEAGGEELEVSLRADLIVEQDGVEQVAEVKTGDAAPRLDNAATRRQLLEYAVAHGSGSVLLVDVEAGEVTEVHFPGAGGQMQNGRRAG